MDKVEFFFTLIHKADGGKAYDYCRTVNGYLDVVVRGTNYADALAKMQTKLAERDAEINALVIVD